MLTQPKIHESMNDVSKGAYKTLLEAAYSLAVDGLPFSHFKTLVKVMKNCGARLISKYDNSNRAKEFVSTLAQAVREKVSSILDSVTSFSLLTDGSQARKTGSEKELAFVKVVHDGNPTFLCAALCDVDKYGDANADNLKKSIDDVFQNNLKIGAENYPKKLISFTTDGASVNTGVHNGLIKKFRDDRNWIVDIHCTLHRLELAVKDSLMKKTEFSNVYDFMVLIYYQFKKSGKLSRHFKKMSEIYDARILKFPKVHGTRFISHQLRGLNILLENWIVFGLTLEDMIKTNKSAKTTAKLQGILKKLKDYTFLCTCIYYSDIISHLSSLSLCLEKNSIMITEVMPCVERTISDLEDLGANTESNMGNLTERCKQKGFNLITATSAIGITEHSITKESLRMNHGRLQKEKQEMTVLTLSGIKNVNRALTLISGTEITDNIICCLTERFSSFSLQAIYKYMFWVDPANWSDTETEMEAITWCYNHFKVTLDHKNIEFSKVKSEWKDLKRTVGHFYHGVQAHSLWPKIFSYRNLQYKNLLMIVEALLCLGPSNSIVEAGFSHLTGMLSDRRISLSHESMEDLLMIKVNDLVWTDQERSAIIESALNSYLTSKRRKHMLQQIPAVQQTKTSNNIHNVTDIDTNVDSCDEEQHFMSSSEDDNMCYDDIDESVLDRIMD